MASMEDLYQEIILDHNKRPRNFGPLSGATHRADGHNPLCGDELHVSARVCDGRLVEVKFQGQGCAISKASASLMTEAVAGQRLDEARRTIQQVIGGVGPAGPNLKFEEVGDVAALPGVRQFPARVKCATLAWHALLCAIEGRNKVSTESGGS